MKKNAFIKCSLHHCIYFIIALVLSYVLAAIIVEGNTLIGDAIDRMLSGASVEFKQFLLKLLIMVALGFITAWVKSFAISRFSVMVQTDYKTAIARKLFHLEYRYFDENGSASVINKMNEDIAGADTLLTENLPEICTNAVSIITYAFYVGRLNITLLILMLICYPLILLLSNLLVKKIVALKKIHRQKSDRMSEISQDCISGVLVLRSFVAEDLFQKDMDEAANDLVENEKKRTRISNSAIIVRKMLQWLPSIICSIYAYHLVMQGNISLGGLMAFLMILIAFVDAFVGLPFNFIDAKENSVCISRLEDILSAPDEPSGNQKTGTTGDNTYESAITFNNVSFSYTEGIEVLRNISFDIKKGESVAFVGDSGGGKSTIFHLLCGFYPINKGSYTLLGTDFKSWDIASARSHMALVSQNVFLFPDTIMQNVAYGKPDASEDEIINACKLARIHDFIVSLPNGYDSVVGERGILLSGGEKQRISIARAILKDAPILLLDEPTSAVDVATEQLIQEAIENLSRNRTCITIAHRLSTIEHVDRIMVLKDGNIAETGSHKQLLANKGLYYQMYGKEVD